MNSQGTGSGRATLEPLERRQLFTAAVEPAGVVDATAEAEVVGEAGPHPAPAAAVVRSAEAASGPAAGQGFAPRVLFRDAVAHDMVSPVRRISVVNTGRRPMTIPAGGLSIEGAYADRFQVVAQPSLPLTLGPGESFDAAVMFVPGAGEHGGVRTATLRLHTGESTVEVALHGSIAGYGSGEPTDRAGDRSGLFQTRVPVAKAA